MSQEESSFQRCPHDRQNPYVMINNDLIRDKSISRDARFFLIYLLSHVGEWDIRKNHIMKELGIGKFLFKRITDELYKAGYMKRDTYVNKQGLTRTKYFVSEFKKFLPCTNEQGLGNSDPTNKEDILKKKDLPLTPSYPQSQKTSPKKNQEEKPKKKSLSRIQKAAKDLESEGISPEVTKEAVRIYEAQEPGSVGNVLGWLRSVCQHVSEKKSAHPLVQKRRDFSLKMADWEVTTEGVVIYSASGHSSKRSFRGDNEFWSRFKL